MGLRRSFPTDLVMMRRYGLETGLPNGRPVSLECSNLGKASPVRQSPKTGKQPVSSSVWFLCRTCAAPARVWPERGGTRRHDTEFETNEIKTIAGNRRSCLGFFYRLDNFESCIARFGSGRIPFGFFSCGRALPVAVAEGAPSVAPTFIRSANRRMASEALEAPLAESPKRNALRISS